MGAFQLFYDLETSTNDEDRLKRVQAATEVLSQDIFGTKSIQNARLIIKEARLLVTKIQAEATDRDSLRASSILVTATARFYLFDGCLFDCLMSLQQAVLLDSEIVDNPNWKMVETLFNARTFDGHMLNQASKLDIPVATSPYENRLQNFLKLVDLEFVPRELDAWGSFYFHQDLVPLMREVRAEGGNRDKLLMFIASRTRLNIKHVRKIQTPRNLKRQSMLVGETGHDILILLHVAEILEKIEQSFGYDVQSRMLDQFQNMVEKLWDVEAYILSLLAGAATCKRLGWDLSIRHFLLQYERASLGLTLGRTNDLFGMISCLDSESRPSNPTLSSLPSIARELSWTWLRSKVWDAMSHERFAAKAKADLNSILEKVVLENIDNVGGAFQKVAQLGAQIEGLVPDAVRERLGQSYESNHVLDPELVVNQFIEGLGKNPADLFKSISLNPFATGSLGQVHNVVFNNGEKGVVKLLFPDLQKSIEKDFSELKKYLWLIKVIFPHSKADQALAEWKRCILRECDYSHELSCQEFSHETLKPFPDLNVPKTYRDLCCANILTQNLVQGDSLFEVIENGTQEQRNLAGKLIFKSLVVLLRAGLFRYDIHPGNYLLEGQVLHCLDFGGSVWTKGSGHNFLEIIAAVQQNDREEFERQSIKSKFYSDIDLIRKNGTFERNRDLILRPFVKNEKFRFNPKFAAEVFQGQTGIEAKATRGYLPDTQEQVDIRFYWSLYSLLGQLRAEANWFEILANPV